MKPAAAILLAATLAAQPALLADEAGIPGLLTFNNSDQLHGSFAGFTDGARILWKRDDVAQPPAFDLANVRRIVFRGGKPETSLPAEAHASLANGDRIPGRIVSLDAARAVIETTFAGTVGIPRDQLGALSPNPHGGRLHYQGPFSAEDWEILDPPVTVIQGDRNDGAVEEAPADGDDAPKGWTHAGAAWYWPGAGATKALVRKDTLPDSTVMRFQVSWKSRVSLAVAFHADFKETAPPAKAGEKDDEQAARRIHPSDSSLYPRVFGNAYVVQLNATHALVYRSTVDAEGKHNVTRMQSGFNNVRIGEAGSATVEIRASRTTGEISLFINDAFVAQWSEIGDPDDADALRGYIGTGKGFGFLLQSGSSPVRISEITIANWNGMPDAARSMQLADQDVVLLTSGADRFSGKVTRIAEGTLSLEGRYGSLDFPLDEVAEVRFARNTLAKHEKPSDKEVRLRLHPLGLVSGIPLSGDSRTLRLEHPICGPLDIDLSSAVTLAAHNGETFLDAWDPDF